MCHCYFKYKALWALMAISDIRLLSHTPIGLNGCRAENDRKHDDLDVGAIGYKTPWPTQKHLANMGEMIHMQEESICKKNAGE